MCFVLLSDASFSALKTQIQALFAEILARQVLQAPLPHL